MLLKELASDIWNYIEPRNSALLWTCIFFSLVILTPILSKIRDARLLKTVTSRKRGTKSERKLVLKLLKKGYPAQTIFHDLYVRNGSGKFSQIDAVLVTTEAIIVFEVKDYSGWIFGDGKRTQWTKVLAYGKRKYKFFNPIIQNNGHIKALKGRLKQFENIPFYSVIVFYGNCELKEINYVPEGTFLVKPKRIFKVLKIIRKKNGPAPYTNKQNVVKVMRDSVNNGDYIKNRKKHSEDIKDLLGQHRIFR